MDIYSGYDQIFMHPSNEKTTSLITLRGLYYYKMMPFGLKNTGATYQRSVTKIFVDFFCKTMEVYVDNMPIKSLKAIDHVKHLDADF